MVYLYTFNSDTKTYNELQFFGKPFVIDKTLKVQNKEYHLAFLIDFGCHSHSFVYKNLVKEIYDKLQITPVLFARSIPIKSYNGVIAKRPVTYAIYLGLFLMNHRKLSLLMFIVDLGYNATIFGKP